jgi:hypothetical protein
VEQFEGDKRIRPYENQGGDPERRSDGPVESQFHVAQVVHIAYAVAVVFENALNADPA